MEIKNYNILIFGSKNAGKSSILTKYIENRMLFFYENIVNYYSKTKVIENGEERINLNFEKISNLEHLTEDKLKNINAFILVYDKTNIDSLKLIYKARDLIFDIIDPIFKDCFPIIIAGNKFDEKDPEYKTPECLVEFLENYKYIHIKISAQTKNNVEELFKNITSQIQYFEKNKDKVLENYNNVDDACCCNIF